MIVIYRNQVQLWCLRKYIHLNRIFNSCIL